MKRSNGKVLAILFASVFFLVTPLVSFAQEGFDVRIQITKTTILLGEPVWVDVRVTNRSQESLTIDTSPACFMFGTRPLKVEIPAAEPGSGEHVLCGHPGGDCYETWAEIKPGEILTRRYVLSGDFRITHPGNYSVLLEKRIRYGPTPLAGPPSMKQEQTESVRVALNVLPADPDRLLAIEQTLAQQATEPIPPPPPFPTSTDVNGEQAYEEAIRRAAENRKKIEIDAVQAQQSIAEGLTAYPAAGMEPVFRVWLEGGGLDGYAIPGLRHLNTPAAREVLAQVAEFSTIPNDTRYQSHRFAAVSALVDMGDKSYLPLVERLTGDNNREVQRAAVRGLGLLGGEQELPFLTTLAREATNWVDRQDAIQSMGETASLKAVPIITDLFTLPDSDQPAASIGALSMLTHHQLPLTTRRTLLETQSAWQDWWTQNQRSALAYDPFECPATN